MNEEIDWEAVVARPPPRKLYRYSADTKWLHATIFDQVLYLSSPPTFNDPFDCQIPCHFSGDQDQALAVTKEILTGSKKMRHQPPRRRLKTYSKAIGSAKTGKLHGADDLKDLLRQGMSKDGIVCFCEDPLSILMWSYYANKHTGVCLEFDTQVESWIAESRQVQYTQNCPHLSFLEPDWDRTFTRLILTKAEAWEHEKEWRFFSAEPPHNRKLAFPPNALTGVIFGARMKPERKAELARKINAMPFAPSLSELIISTEEFELVQRPYLA